ncbi:hypothetical protein Q8F55_001784 [Vanrija albida]|uniref:Uncharacterized protein n=1 Tax=Vanrija albida TaxID=181172 RepID=A0ABR3Q844_9TREE
MRPATPTMVQTTASRLQRASERAWAALASLQPRMNGYDAVPVAQTTPAPPSPTLGPVDAVASESGSEAEASDSIEAFSDTQPEPLLLTSKPLPTLPHVRSSLSLDDDGIAPTEDDPPPRYKKVRFSLQEGDRLLNTLGADPGFKVWRDGY